ncbi:MAG: hypothetical protein WBV82_11360 [Myxococcaceae bacterium]
MNSPRYAPAGLLIELGKTRVMIDGGADMQVGELDAWLVSDERAELMPAIRRRLRGSPLEAGVRSFQKGALRITPKPVVHTNHPAFGYLIEVPQARVGWAPEFLEYPVWATKLDLLFAEAAGWNRRIWFRGRVGGHASATEVAEKARAARVQHLVFAHIGRPTIRAMDEGCVPLFGEFGADGQTWRVTRSGRVSRTRSSPRSSR